MSIRIERVSLEDGEVLMRVGQAAFEYDPLNLSFLPEVMTPEQKEEYFQWRVKNFHKRFNGENRHYFKAVDG